MAGRKNFPPRRAARRESAAQRAEVYGQLTLDEKIARCESNGGARQVAKLRKQLERGKK